MKKEFINPEMEVLRFQKCGDMLLTSLSVRNGDDDYATISKSLSRGKYDDDDDF